MPSALKKYLPLFKFRISSLITFTAVVGLISTSSMPIPISNIFSLILVTMMASMGASMFNHYFDTDIDAVMQRTKKRPMPSGSIAYSKAVLFAALLLFTASILLSFEMLNYMVAVHLFLGGFVYAFVYTVWLKRRSWLNIIIGGLAGSFAVLAGGASATSDVCLLPVLLSVTMFFWTPSHFWSFAIFHREEYERAGVPMLPNLIGDSKTARYILFNTIFLVLSSFLPSLFGYFGLFYTIAAFCFGAFFIVRNIQLLNNISKKTAWKNFKASMIYLAGLFIAVIMDVILFRMH